MGPLGRGPFSTSVFFEPPAQKDLLHKEVPNFSCPENGGPRGGDLASKRTPPRQLNLGSDLGSSWGPRSGSVWGPSGVPFGPPKVASFSGPETRPKPYIYNGFSDFRTLEKRLQSDPLEGPHLASRGGPKISEKGVQNFRKRCNYNTFAISGGPFGTPFWIPFLGPCGGPF